MTFNLPHYCGDITILTISYGASGSELITDMSELEKEAHISHPSDDFPTLTHRGVPRGDLSKHCLINVIFTNRFVSIYLFIYLIL